MPRALKRKADGNQQIDQGKQTSDDEIQGSETSPSSSPIRGTCDERKRFALTLKMFITQRPQRAQALVSGTKNIFIYQTQVPVIHSFNGTSTIYIVYTYWTLSIFCRLYDPPPPLFFVKTPVTHPKCAVFLQTY